MIHSHTTHTHLASYVEAVATVVDQIIRHTGISSEQLELLLPRISNNKVDSTKKVLIHPLAPFYFAVRAHGVPVGSDAEALGAGFLLFHRALSLIDNVQDDELTGPYADMGSAVAINNGLTLFFLALDTFWAAEQDNRLLSKAWNLRSSLRFHALRLSQGQHRDLTGRGQLKTPAAALEIATEKSAIYTLLMEYAGLYAATATSTRLGVGPKPYRIIGDALAQIQQVIDDVVELFDASDSQDLRSGTWNVPLTILFDTMPEAERPQWATRLRDTAKDDVCHLLYDTKAMYRIATIVEAARLCIHQTFATLPCRGPYLAMLLAWLDDLVATLYIPPVVTLGVDIHTVDHTGLHPADAVLFEQLRRACCAAQEAQKTVKTHNTQNKRTHLCTASTAGRGIHIGGHDHE